MEHFDKLAGGKYKADYFDSDKVYYSTLAKHMDSSFCRWGNLLDIGAGPGCSAMLAHDLGLELQINGLEPSELYNDSVALQKELIEKDSCVIYNPIKGGIESLEGYVRKLDGVIVSRALHEIARSLEGIDKIYDQLVKTDSYVRKGGVFVVGEPQFTKEALEHHYSDEVIKAARKCTEAKYGHSSGPEEFINRDMFVGWMEKLGYSVILEDRIQDLTETLDAVREAGFKLEKSPYESYIISMRKG
tara:strand:+ start:93 stop:827 length:735 start_codon:yes stop_codon:yes gene_type:complete